MDNTRRTLIKAAGIGACALCAAPAVVDAAPAEAAQAVIDNILTRRSVRSFSIEPVSEEAIETMLQCAMAAPSAANEQPWDFVVIRDAETMEKIASINKYARFAAMAPLGILVCMNNEKVKIGGMSVLDMGMASENLMLAAHALGLGSVFTGIFPMEDRIKAFRELFDLPAAVVPMGLIIVGHPTDPSSKTAPERFKRENIHLEKWGGK
ncbi:MAG: nitroreductase family protein [Desulfovibrio sp.]|nr:nitroreductase family protein [Desulfovibrio sp.]